MKNFLFLLIVVAATVGFAPKSFSEKKWPTPNTNAPIGGTMVRNFAGEPQTLHPISSADVYGRYVHEYVMDTLLFQGESSWDYVPRLAEKYEVSKDGKVFTFHLRKNATWHDGKPVTTEDVKFSFDAIFEPAYNAAHLRSYFESFNKVEIVDTHTIKFYAKESYALNLDALGTTLIIMPKHIYSNVEKSKNMNRELVGCGPYKLEKYERGNRIVLKRNESWYGFTSNDWKGRYNFNTLIMRFVLDTNVEMEMLKKGDLDFSYPITAEAYATKTSGEPWGKKVFAVKAENDRFKSYGFVGWNMRNELFKEKNVRRALAMLMNRDEMNNKFRYGLSELARGPVFNRSPYASAKVKAIPFDPKKASEMLAKAGWKDTDKNGLLDKMINGKKYEMKFTVVYANKDTEKYLTIYKEDLKKAGVEMELKFLEWTSFSKLLDEGKFDAITMAWGGTSDWDPKQIWYSTNAVPGGSNFVAYNNPKVDKMIDVARIEPNKAKRIKLLQEVYEQIAEDAPYVFLFNNKYELYAHSSKIQKPGDAYKVDIGHQSWWSTAP